MTLLLLTPENDDLGNCPRLSDLHSWSVSNLDLLIWVPRTASLDSSQSIMRYMLTPDAAANWETEVGLSSEIRLETSSDLQKGARRSCRHFFPREINSEIFFMDEYQIRLFFMNITKRLYVNWNQKQRTNEMITLRSVSEQGGGEG